MMRRGYLSELELMILLALVRLGDEAYGVPIAQEIARHTGREVALGSVYAALERMEERRMVTSRLGDATSVRGGRAKRFFQVTRSGMRAMRETQRALVSLWSGLPAIAEGKA